MRTTYIATLPSAYNISTSVSFTLALPNESRRSHSELRRKMRMAILSATTYSKEDLKCRCQCICNCTNSISDANPSLSIKRHLCSQCYLEGGHVNHFNVEECLVCYGNKRLIFKDVDVAIDFLPNSISCTCSPEY